MGERYKQWLEDPVAKQIIEAYGLTELPDEAQSAFELLVSVKGKNGKNIKYEPRVRAAKALDSFTGDRKATFRLINDFQASVIETERNSWPKTGTQPTVDGEDGTYSQVLSTWTFSRGKIRVPYTIGGSKIRDY